MFPNAGKAGDRYSIQTASASLYEGAIQYNQPPLAFCATVDNLNNALLLLGLGERAGIRETNIWLSAYGIPQSQIDTLGKQWAEEIKTLLSGQIHSVYPAR